MINFPFVIETSDIDEGSYGGSDDDSSNSKNNSKVDRLVKFGGPF